MHNPRLIHNYHSWGVLWRIHSGKASAVVHSVLSCSVARLPLRSRLLRCRCRPPRSGTWRRAGAPTPSSRTPSAPGTGGSGDRESRPRPRWRWVCWCAALSGRYPRQSVWPHGSRWSERVLGRSGAQVRWVGGQSSGGSFLSRISLQFYHWDGKKSYRLWWKKVLFNTLIHQK